MRPTLVHALAIPTLVLLIAPASAHRTDPGREPPLYRPIDLGVVPGWTFSRAVDVNDKRQVTGFLGDDSGYMAFVWLPRPELGLPAGMSVLGTLPLGDHYGSRASGINDCGQIVGITSGGTVPRGFLWQEGVMDDLGALEGLGSPWCGAAAINRKGTIVGSSGVMSINSTVHAFATRVRCGDRPDGELVDLGSLSGHWSWAAGVNDKDQIVGATSLRLPPGDVIAAPFFHDPSDGSVDLPMLAGLGPGAIDSGRAQAINDRGVIVGSCLSVRGNRITERAVLWRRTRDGWSTTELGTFPGKPRNFPTDIDERDRVVGFAIANGELEATAYLWIDGVFHALDDLLVTSQPIRIVETGGINDRGDIAAGGYNAQGEYRAFLLLCVRD
jgi:probable HAF family extracellular repeat protein